MEKKRRKENEALDRHPKNMQCGECNICGFLMQILGALVTHVGSGISFEVTSALDTMIILVSKYAHELVPLSSHINGILIIVRFCT